MSAALPGATLGLRVVAYTAWLALLHRHERREPREERRCRAMYVTFLAVTLQAHGDYAGVQTLM